ncbi:hypothetical protein B0H16DRAFT_507704 [Mycena metata]|uniref:Uncharacterized protein n=1 Tax=Mycena metata TaxID=1033252 RepID=A0AAD7H9L8_9AGAR|nr:hypothetical protein B0H16DRAFT_507704 [Mycena metata]
MGGRERSLGAERRGVQKLAVGELLSGAYILLVCITSFLPGVSSIYILPAKIPSVPHCMCPCNCTDDLLTLTCPTEPPAPLFLPIRKLACCTTGTSATPRYAPQLSVEGAHLFPPPSIRCVCAAARGSRAGCPEEMTDGPDGGNPGSRGMEELDSRETRASGNSDGRF